LQECEADGRRRAEVARELYEQWEDGRIKLFLTQAALHARRDNPDLFAGGAYHPLEPTGPRAANLVAFSRTSHGRTAVAVVPRLVSGLLDGAWLRPDKFGGTVVPVSGRFVDVFTGEEREGPLRADKLFSNLPVALLLSR